MEHTMAWKDISVSGDADTAGRYVREAILARRRAGQKNETAINEAALALGLTERRARGFFYGEVFKAAAGETRRILRLWWSDQDRQAAELHAEANRMEQTAEAEWLRLHQFELPLEKPCHSLRPSSLGSSSNGRGGQ